MPIDRELKGGGVRFSQKYKGQQEIRISKPSKFISGYRGKKKWPRVSLQKLMGAGKRGQISLLTFGVESSLSSYGIGPSSWGIPDVDLSKSAGSFPLEIGWCELMEMPPPFTWKIELQVFNNWINVFHQLSKSIN